MAHKGQRLSAKDFGVKLHGYSTKAEAREAAGELQVKLAALAFRATSGATVADYLAAWLEGREVSAKTRADYGKYLRLYINPAIGGVPLRDLTPEAIGSVLRQLSDRPATARVAYGMLRKAFSYAHKRGHVASNPAALVDAPRYCTTRGTCRIYDLKAGAQVPVVSARLGHSSVAMTLNVYWKHVPNAWQREAAEARGRLIFGG